MFFNIYYLNFTKTYEIKMIISNIIHTGSSVETSDSDSSDAELKASLGAKFLKLFGAEVGASAKFLSADSQKVIEAFEVKSTKSVILNDVIEKCDSIESLETAKEGQLLRIDGVRLQLVNEMELRSVKMFSSGAFKGASFMQVEGIDLNNALNSAFKDYAYKIKGKTLNDEPLLIKIPMTFENEFESLYNIDDLFIGKMTLVGIYKGKIKLNSLKNTFEFFQEFGGSSNTEPEVRNSQLPAKPAQQIQFGYEEDDVEYHYIDLLAIVQRIESTDESDVSKKSRKKKG